MDPNERLTGIQQLPMGGGQPPMGGPPMGGQPPMPPMGGPPPMSGPPPGMGGGQPSMDPGMGEMAMQGQPPMEEPQAQANPEQDAGMLAEAVVGRAGGDINGAIAMLDTAKAMLMSAAQGSQEPQMAMNGGPMYANMGGPLDYNMGGPMYANMGRPLYRGDGGGMSDDDMLRQMIMESLSQPQRRESGGQLNSGLQQLQKTNPEVVKQILGKADGGSMSAKGKAMADLMSYRMA